MGMMCIIITDTLVIWEHYIIKTAALLEDNAL